MKSIEVYEFHELSPQAKERAKASSYFEPSWCEEYLQSINAYSDHYGMTTVVKDLDRMDYDIRGRIRRHKLSDIPHFLTGFYADEVFRMEMSQVWRVTGNADKAFRDAIHAVLRAWISDQEEQWNEWEFAGSFTVDGERCTS